ncbi:MAG: hypothetical protein PVG32_15945 [Anaerolineales bacterium]|jgi:hypothetical protein
MGRSPTLVYHATNIVKQHTLSLLLLLGAVHGLIYLLLIPPWQHYDEPGNFEYTWLIANHRGLPQRGEYDQRMRREVAASMVEHDFYDKLQGRPNLLSLNEPINIGISQLGDPPFYYQLTSLPLILLKGADISFQLFIGRLVSWVLLIISILSAWGITKELTQPKNPLRWMVPLSLALLPGYLDIMTSFNNDVGATSFFSLFLWGAVNTIKRGVTWKKLFWITGTTVICLITKSTVYIVLPLFGITILFTILRNNQRKWAWYVIWISGLALLLLTFTWGEAKQWYRHDPYYYQTRFKIANAPIGDYAFLFAVQDGMVKPQISQVLTPMKLDDIRGKTVTIGAWAWADRSTIVRIPVLSDGETYSTQTVDIGRKPEFYAYHTAIKEDIERVHILLSPLTTRSQENVNIYYDGVILAIGYYSGNNPPEFSDSTGREGTWGGKSFENLIDNPSAEFGVLSVRPRVDSLIQKYFPIKLSWVFYSFMDWSKSAWYYKSTITNLLRTFWGKFGWGQVSLLGGKPYRVLAAVTLVGLIGAVVNLLRGQKDLFREVSMLFGLAILFIWGAALFRGISSAFATNNRVFIPASRYAYPAIIPTMIALNMGWLEIIRFIQKWIRISKIYLIGVYILFFLGLDFLSILSIHRFYNS